jgi:cholesterol oxidase
MPRSRARRGCQPSWRFWFEGDEHIADDRGLDLWSDTTTLDVTLTEGEAPGGALLGRGMLHVEPAAFLRQPRTTRAVTARGRAERLAAVARFGAHFAGGLWDVYGGVFARPTVFDPTAPPRKKRPLHDLT